MINLIEGQIYSCSDGEERKLMKIEENFLHYSVPIAVRNHQVVWMNLSKTYRHQCEKLFVNGKIISEQEIIEDDANHRQTKS